MATFLDVSVLQHFSTLFVFLLVFVVVYGFLLMSKIFAKGNEEIAGSRGLYAIIALTAAFFVSVSGGAAAVVSTMTPWFGVFIIFLFLIFFAFKMFGVDETQFQNVVKMKEVYWSILVVAILIVIASFSSSFGQNLLNDNSEIVTNPGAPNTVVMQENNGVTPNQSTTSNRLTMTDINIQERQTEQGSTATSDFGSNVLNTIIHPKVLGMLLLLFIAFFAIIFMTSTQNVS